MYLKSIKFTGAFPEGDKVVEISSPSGGGCSYRILVDNYHCGVIGLMSTGWRVQIELKDHEFTSGELEPLLELVQNQTIV